MVRRPRPRGRQCHARVTRPPTAFAAWTPPAPRRKTAGMTHPLPRLALAFVTTALLALAAPARAADAPDHPAAPKSEAAKESGGSLYHVVSLKFKPGADPAKVKAVEEAFVALKTKIPGIKTLTWGTNVSPEKNDKGFTHCFVLSFATAKDRDAYLVHPEHKAFGKVLGPVMGDVFVLDFWGKE
ncbi:MAG: Dabb family protein [Phycisphaerales bacterium]|nr:Dabb family protein [Phycisphaerales bacterium]